uniref:Uncharacterized protein n=1 Tax=Anguilla anguilla TaxID=7936 RepID=A0A0E9RPY2_ANGAN
MFREGHLCLTEEP